MNYGTESIGMRDWVASSEPTSLRPAELVVLRSWERVLRREAAYRARPTRTNYVRMIAAKHSASQALDRFAHAWRANRGL